MRKVARQLPSLFTLMGTFQQLFTAVIFTAWIFYGLSVLGVIILRIKEPALERPYRCPFYPIPPLLFVLATMWIVWNTLMTDIKRASLGLALIAVGIPVYLVFRSIHDKSEKKQPAST